MIGSRRKDSDSVMSDVPVDLVELAAELGRERQVDAARRRHLLERERAEASYGRDRADLAEALRLAELERAERAEDIAANLALARLYRQARAAGERTRITSEMARSGEARALRLDRLRRRNLIVLVPLLIGFGVWSTTGVQQGAAVLMAVDAYSPVWWVLWGLEALLIGLVCWVIICRATLGSAGGHLDSAAEKIAAGALTVSVFLNLIAAVPGAGETASAGWWAVPGSMFAHLIGPVGAAVTAHLIGVVDRSITGADPWTGQDGRPAPRLAGMELAAPALVTAAPVLGALDGDHPAESASAPESALASVPATVWPVPRGERPPLPITARPTTAEPAERSADDQVSRPVPKAARKPRSDKGVTLPASAKKAPEPSPRALSDDALVDRLVAAIDAEKVPEDVSIRQVQTALGIGFSRAKRIKELYAERLAEMDREITQDVARPGLAVVGGARR